MRNQETRGDSMMQEDLRVTDSVDETTAASAADTDESEASDMMEAIGQDAAAEVVVEEKAPAALRTSRGASPFLLESLYFRSFGERALLTREEEIALAKRVDEGTRRIRVALRQMLKVLGRARRTPGVLDAMTSLQLARRLGDRIGTWLVMNEPHIFTWLGYEAGLHAPGHREEAEYKQNERHTHLTPARNYEGIVALFDCLSKTNVSNLHPGNIILNNSLQQA